MTIANKTLSDSRILDSINWFSYRCTQCYRFVRQLIHFFETQLYVDYIGRSEKDSPAFQ